jgi:hypothetical protein
MRTWTMQPGLHCSSPTLRVTYEQIVAAQETQQEPDQFA